MKNTLVSLFIFFASVSFGQYGQVSPLDHDTCLDRQFSVVFYVVLDSTYSPLPANTASLALLIQTMNACFKPICVSFQNCSTVFIPNYPYNKWKKDITEPVITTNWYTDKTLNIYLVDTVKQEAINTEGLYAYTYTYPPASPIVPKKDLIVMSKGIFNTPDFGLFFHQLGHFFGLVHTYDEIGSPTPPVTFPAPNGIISQEYADGTNCAIHGDCICDTEADPQSTSQILDGKGDHYILPIDNYMSYLGLCRYTQQQYNLMAYTILTKRLYLH